MYNYIKINSTEEDSAIFLFLLFIINKNKDNECGGLLYFQTPFAPDF